MTAEINAKVSVNGALALSEDELQGQLAEALPGREAMSLITANIAAPINLALAANVLSDHSLAYASATQNVSIVQTVGG
jgi:hypothetical protein